MHRRLEPVRTGESGALVWKCVGIGPLWYLKAAPVAGGLRLDHEAARLRWMHARQLFAPAVVRYVNTGGSEYLLTEEAAGEPAFEQKWISRPADVAIALGRCLSKLHSVNTVECPFDRRISVQLDEARLRIANGDVREDDFDAIRQGRTATDIFAELLTMVPESEDLVFVHGDFSLPNILLSAEDSGAVNVTGLIDCGRAGIGDRHQDIALAIRSLTYNFDTAAVAPFLATYGRPVDARTTEFFTILDEFF